MEVEELVQRVLVLAEAAIAGQLLGADGGRVQQLLDDAVHGAMDQIPLKDMGRFADAALATQGADPALILSDLAEFVHFVTRLRIIPDARNDAAATEEEVKRGREFAAILGPSVLTRAWQILSKGIQDVRHSPRPLAAAPPSPKDWTLTLADIELF